VNSARLLFSFTLIFFFFGDIGEVSVSPFASSRVLFLLVALRSLLPKSRKKSAFYGIINLFGQINKNLNIKCYHMFSSADSTFCAGHTKKTNRDQPWLLCNDHLQLDAIII
jgi:hypothetical protein